MIDHIARICHEANRVLQTQTGEAVNPPWDEAGPYFQESTRSGVRAALAGSTPEQLHEGWAAERRLDGWSYGPVKDPGMKLHPCLVPYDDLPAEQRVKDSMLRAIVAAFAAGAGA